MNSKQAQPVTAALALIGVAAMSVASFAMPAMKGKMMHGHKMMSSKMMSGRERVMLMPSPLAKNAGLQGATGSSLVDVKNGTVSFSVTLAKGTSLPKGSVLEGWLSTAGKSTASMNDQKYGPAFGKKDVATKSRKIPYALSTGVLHRVNSRTYTGRFKIANSLMPYGAVAITLESDGNAGNYDPRPGTPLLVGMIKHTMMAKM